MRIFFYVLILLFVSCGKSNKPAKLEAIEPAGGGGTQMDSAAIPFVSFEGMENTEIYFDANNVFKNNFQVTPSNQILRRKILRDLSKLGLLKKIIWDQKEFVDYLNLNVIDYSDLKDKLQLEKMVQGLTNLEEMQFSFDAKLIFERFDKSDIISDIQLAFYYYYPLTGELKPIVDAKMIGSSEFFSSDNSQYLHIDKLKFNFSKLKQSLEQNSKLVFQVKDFKIENDNLVQRHNELYANYLKNNAMVIISSKDHTEVHFVPPGIRLKDLADAYSPDLTIDSDGEIQCYMGFCKNIKTFDLTENASELEGKKIWYQSSPLDSVLQAEGVYILLSLEGSELRWYMEQNKMTKKYDSIKTDTEVFVINPHDLIKITIKSFKEIPVFSSSRKTFYGKDLDSSLKRNGSCLGTIKSISGSARQDHPWQEADLKFAMDEKIYTLQELIDNKMMVVREDSASQIEIQFSNVLFKTMQIQMNKTNKTTQVSVGFVGWVDHRGCSLTQFFSPSPQTNMVTFTENHLFDIEIK